MDLSEYLDVFDKTSEVEVQKSSTTKVGMVWATSWGVAGRPTPGGRPSSGVEACEYDTPGSLQFPRPGAGKRSTIVLAKLRSGQSAGGVMLFDRLTHTAPITVNGGGTFAIQSMALPRYSDGEGVEAWIEFNLATNNISNVIMSVEYTNSDGVTGRMSVDIPLSGIMTKENSIKVPLATGDKGIRSVQNVIISTSPTWSAGEISVVMCKRLVTFEYSNAYTLKTYGIMSLQNPDINENACLFLMRAGTTSAPVFNLTMNFGWIDDDF